MVILWKRVFWERWLFNQWHRWSSRIGSYDLLSASPDTLPLSYKRLVGAKATTEQGSSEWQITCILLGQECWYVLMRNDKDVMVNLELVEYMRKMILQSVTQGVLGVLGFSSLWAACVTSWQIIFLRYWAGSTFAITSLSYYSLIEKNNPQVDSKELPYKLEKNQRLNLWFIQGSLNWGAVPVL